jgi:hypothetical protein
MKIKDYIDKQRINYSLTGEDRYEYKIEQFIQKRGIRSVDFEPNDEYLKTLYEEDIRPILTERHNIGKTVIMTLPIGCFNASTVPLSPGSVAIICDNRISYLCAIFSKLIVKCLLPLVKGKNIAPFEADTDKPDESFKVANTAIGNDDYQEFKTAFLYFIGKLEAPDLSVPELSEIEAQMRDAFVLSLLGHEIGHIVKKHYNHKRKGRKIDKVDQKWDIELEADDYGYELMCLAMSRKYSDVEHKAQFNMGFEMFFQCHRIYELLLQIYKAADITNSHPDSGRTRINHLRKKILKDAPKTNDEKKGTVEWAKRQSEIYFPGYIIYTSEMIFDAYEKKLLDEIVASASIIGKKHISHKEFINKLENCLYAQDVKIPDVETAGMSSWREGKFTQALCDFAKDGYRSNFYYILAVLCHYKYEYFLTKMGMGLGQGPKFHAGKECLLERGDLYSAAEYFQEALNEEAEKSTSAFALGLVYSIMGSVCLHNRDAKNAAAYFTKGIQTSPAALESFNGRCYAYALTGNIWAALADKKICGIVSRAPSTLERAQRYAYSLTGNAQGALADDKIYNLISLVPGLLKGRGYR